MAFSIEIEPLEARCVMSGLAAFSAGAVDLPNDPTTSRTGIIQGPGDRGLYRFSTDAEGLLVAQVHAQGLDTLLSLLDDQGRAVIQSRATSPTNLDDRIAQHLPAGTYYLSVSGMAGAGTFALSTTFTPTSTPGRSISEGTGSLTVAVADLNGDRIPDLITADFYNDQILINLGVGDGTFRPATAIPVGSGPVAVLAGDFTGRGSVDLAVANQRSNTVSILMGVGNGTFRPARELNTGAGPIALASGDFDGDGRLDLVVADQTASCVQVFRGIGDGQFVESDRLNGIGSPISIASADLDGDGRADLAVASQGEGDLILLRGRGDGTFSQGPRLAVGRGVRTVIAADLTRDGRPDLAATSLDDGSVTVFKNVDGAFPSSVRITGGKLPSGLVATDLSGDGNPDLVTSDFGSNEVTLFCGLGDGTFRPAVSRPTGSGPIALVAADLNGDGKPEIVTSDYVGLTVSVLVNNGDGTFQSPPRAPITPSPEEVVPADLNGDGIPDLVVPELGTNEVSVLLGRGDGTFRDPIQTPAGSGPFRVAIGDFNGDRIPDLAVVDFLSSSVTILLGVGDGHFRASQTLARGEGLGTIQAADLDHDGHLDLIVANFFTNDVSIFYGQGNGTFAGEVAMPVAYAPSGVAVGDFNGDGRLDFAVSSAGVNGVEVHLGTGGRTFGVPTDFRTGFQPTSLTAADLNGDGRLDLVTANYGSSTLSVLLGVGDGSFRPTSDVPVGAYPFALSVGDFNGDGRADLLSGGFSSTDLVLLPGRGDGTFGSGVPVPSGALAYGLAAADFNRDGQLDFATSNNAMNSVAVSLGRGDGTFSTSREIALLNANSPTITVDLAETGVPYLIAAGANSGTVEILRGQGDGTFLPDSTIDLGGRPSGLISADFNGDGRPDLAIADAELGEVVVLLGLGDGTLVNPIHVRVGGSPHDLIAGDFDGDGHVDLAVADPETNTVTILSGRGDGSFRVGAPMAVGTEPVALVAMDLDNDGRLDLITANRTSGDLTFLRNEGDGRFEVSTRRIARMAPSALVATDLDGDGIVDLAIADETGDRVLILWGLGNGDFSSPRSIETGRGPGALVAIANQGPGKLGHDLIVADAGSHDLMILRGWAERSGGSRFTLNLENPVAGLSVADLNRDSRPDLIITTALETAEVYLADGEGNFFHPDSVVPLPDSAPFVAPDGGILTVDQRGRLLRRDGRPGSPGEFGPPENLVDGSGTNYGQLIPIRLVDGMGGASLSRDKPVLTLRRGTESGILLRDVPLPAGGLYTRLAVGDFDRDGRDDLAILDHGRELVLIFLQAADGSFHQSGPAIRVGAGPTDLTAADLDHDGWTDIVVANGASGDLSILYGGPDVVFRPEIRLPGGLGPAGGFYETDGDGLIRSSPVEPIGVVAGVFDSSGFADVVVLDRGSDRISILKGIPGGGLADPNLGTTYSTGLHPTQVLAAPLRSGGALDLAVLNQGSHDISIFLNDGRGGLVALPRVDAGNDPTGLAVEDINGDGMPDLLVGNDDGDLLILIGRGDGTFQPYQRADRTVNLAVGDLTGNGQTDFVLSNRSRDLLTVQTSGTSPDFFQGRGDGLLAPGPVAIADMNGDGIADLIVTNTGGNDVFVYLGLGQGHFDSPQRFFTGTAPVGLTVARLTGGKLPDLVVANSGSNDVTILLGTNRPDGSWTMTPGPRLRTGDRPVSITVADLSGDGWADLVVVNQDSNSVSVLDGLGGGFFDDDHPQVLGTGSTPVQALVGHFTSATSLGLLVLNSLSDSMTYYASPTAAAYSISTGGRDPLAGVAGDFNNDGFTDLAVANNGDSRITLFYGGARGLTLAESISLGVSERPTDLVVSGSSTGGLRFFVGAEGQDRAISIVFVSIVGPGYEASTAPTSGGGSGSGRSSDSSGEASESRGFNPVFFAQSANLSSPQTQEFSQSGSPGSGASGAGGAAGVVVTILSQTAQALFSPSMRSLSWLVDNLVRVGQDQTSEILPMGEDEMAAVAVLLAAPSLSATPDDLDSPGDPDQARWATRAASLRRAAHESRPLTRLERFVSDLEPSIDELAREVAASASLEENVSSEWVWYRKSSDSLRMPAPSIEGQAEPSDRASDRRAVGLDAEVDAALNGTAEGFSMVDEDDFEQEATPEGLAIGTVSSLAALASAAVGFLARRRLAGKDTESSTKRDGRRVRPGPAPEHRTGSGGLSIASSRTRPPLDLPPWMKGPVISKSRWTDSGRVFASTLFRKRGSRIRADRGKS